MNRGECIMISKKILAIMFYTFVLGLSVWELFINRIMGIL